jgi:hypothetical protein
MAENQASQNPGYCELCGPNCKHCFGDPLTRSFPPARKDVNGVIGGLAFDPTIQKWVCAADYDYEAAEARRGR